MSRGGKRPGAGRRAGPRLDPSAVRAMLDDLAAGRTAAALAADLGVSTQAVRLVRSQGMTEAQAADWRRRLTHKRPPSGEAEGQSLTGV